MKTGKCDLCGYRGVRFPSGYCAKCEQGRQAARGVALTAEQIWKRAGDYSGNPRKVINKLFRLQDDSHLWPVSGRFNVTERAIRKARWFERESGCMLDDLEYALFIESECSRIVNDPKNM